MCLLFKKREVIILKGAKERPEIAIMVWSGLITLSSSPSAFAHLPVPPLIRGEHRAVLGREVGD